MSLTRTLYDIFFQDSTHYSLGLLEPDGSLKYHATKGIPSLSLIDEHIEKKTVLGAYTVSPGNTIRWIAWDVDSKLGIEKAREIAKKISDFLAANDIPHAIEFSGSKGYHIWIFLLEKETAEKGKRLGEALRDFFGFAKSGQLHVEVYPKQSEVDTDNGKIGSLLRLPLGRHPKTGRETFFVNTTDWEDGVALDSEKILSEKTSLDLLEKALEEADPLEKIANLLIPYWSDGQRHDITLCTAGMAATSGMSKERCEELIELIHDSVPEGSLKDQLKAVESTYKRYANGEKILGENGLATLIPARTLMQIRVLMGSSSASLILQSIDALRLEKNAAFIKVRNVANSAVAYLKEHGRLVRDQNDVFWLNYDDYQLTMVDSPAWERLAHNLFGLNLAESFGRQVAESVRHMSYEAAKIVTVAKRSHWDKKTKMWYFNGGGKEIYICDGTENIQVVYNGEIDILFRNSDDTMCLPNLLEEEDILDPWKMLIDDVNFLDGDVSAYQQRQLTVAAICAMFFPEAMPTRPIVMVMGDPGSGKTTTARRILWCLEGTNEDVLGQVPDKADALRASMAAHRMIVIDNIENTRVAWLPDTLNRAATGSQIELRELHTTNRVRKIIFNIFVWMTGTEIPFSEEAVYTRILPIVLKKLDVYQSEGEIQSNIANNYNAFWKGMLFELNKVVALLRKNSDLTFPSHTRLADFAVFCNRIKDADFLDSEALMAGLDNLVNRQKEILKEFSPFITILDGLIKTRPEEMRNFMSMSELYARAQRHAALHKQRFDWSTPQALSKHVAMMEDQMARHYGMVIKTDREGGREIKKYKFNSAVTVSAKKIDSSEKVH